MDEKLQKIAADVPGVLLAASQQLEKMASNQGALVQRAETAEREVVAMKLARRMEERGLHPELNYDQKVAELRDADPRRIEAIESGIEFAAGGYRLGKVASHTDDGVTAGASGDPLEAFVLSQHAYGT